MFTDTNWRGLKVRKLIHLTINKHQMLYISMGGALTCSLVDLSCLGADRLSLKMLYPWMTFWWSVHCAFKQLNLQMPFCSVFTSPFLLGKYGWRWKGKEGFRPEVRPVPHGWKRRQAQSRAKSLGSFWSQDWSGRGLFLYRCQQEQR